MVFHPRRAGGLLGVLSIVMALFAILVGAAPRPAFAADPQVRDDAGFFSAGAVQQANDIIRQIKTVHNKDFIVETYPGIPPEMQGQYSAQNKEHFYEQWLKQRGEQLGANGVLVLITRDPPYIRADAGGETKKRAFTQSNVDQLTQILARAFKAKQFDEGLLDATKYVQQTFDRNMSSGAGGGASGANTGGSNGPAPGPAALPGPQSPSSNLPPASSSPPPVRRSGSGFGLLGGCLPVLLIIIGIIVVVSIIRRLRGGGTRGGYGGYGGAPGSGGPYPPPGGYGYGGYGGGGGGFGRGLLGGLLGGWFGGWAQDRWSHSGTAQGAPPTSPPNAGGWNEPASPSFPSDQGHGFGEGGAGADFGSSDTGSSFGGGGGGDFGGGGGGGDFGGGGGGGGGDSGSGASF